MPERNSFYGYISVSFLPSLRRPCIQNCPQVFCPREPPLFRMSSVHRTTAVSVGRYQLLEYSRDYVCTTKPPSSCPLYLLPSASGFRLWQFCSPRRVGGMKLRVALIWSRLAYSLLDVAVNWKGLWSCVRVRCMICTNARCKRNFEMATLVFVRELKLDSESADLSFQISIQIEIISIN